MRLVVVLLAALGTAACGSSQTPAPTDEPIVGTFEDRDIRLTVTLAAPPVRFAPTWADVVVENRGKRAVDWTSSFCDDTADVSIDVAAAFREGRGWPERLGIFKDRAAMTGWTTGEFLPERELPPRGDGVCDGQHGVERLPAGGSLRGQYVWRGTLGFQTAVVTPVPPGPATIVASFGLVGPRILPPPPGGVPEQPITATIETRVQPRPGDSPLSPGLAVDAALADPGFAAWVLAAHEDTWSHVSVAMERDTWLIQLIRRKPGDRPESGWLGEIRIGPRGEVVSRRTDVRTPGDCPDPTVC